MTKEFEITERPNGVFLVLNKYNFKENVMVPQGCIRLLGGTNNILDVFEALESVLDVMTDSDYDLEQTQSDEPLDLRCMWGSDLYEGTDADREAYDSGYEDGRNDGYDEGYYDGDSEQEDRISELEADIMELEAALDECQANNS